MTKKVQHTPADSKSTQPITEKIDTVNTRAFQLLQTNPDEAQLLAEEALALAEKENYKKGAAHALCTLGWINYLKGNFALMLEQSLRALVLAEKIDDVNLKARACNNIGNVYERTGEYGKALEYFVKALALWEKIGDRIDISASINNIGLVYLMTGEYDKALDYFMRSLILREEANDKRRIAASLDNIGLVYYSLQDFSKALEYQKHSLAIRDEIGDTRGAAISCSNIGNTYAKIGQHATSLEYYRRTLAFMEESGDKYGISISLSNIGVTYQKTGEYDSALNYCQRSLAIREEIGDKHGISNSLFNIGEIYATQKFDDYNSGKALEYLSKSLALAEDIGDRNSMIDTHKLLAEVYEQVNNMAKAHEHFKKYHFLKEEVFSEETTKKVQNLETQRKFAEIEKEREITEKLLHRILPHAIAKRMRDGEENIADKFSSASVLFADIVGFTPLAEKLGADEVLKLLSGIFSHFDSLCEELGVEKIKTIGDEYMAASGVPVECDDHAEKIARLALSMQEDLKLNLDFKIPELSIRIGIHTGEVIAGVLGTQKLSYDIWGDTVNTASRMESTGEPDKIQVSEQVFKALENKFIFKERGETEIKGKGRMKTYFLLKER